jgi:hypothetical protein
VNSEQSGEKERNRESRMAKRSLARDQSGEQRAGQLLATADGPLPYPRRAGRKAPVAPTIKVTIGRIEVRATGPEKTAESAPGPVKAPVMSLDEYLRQRDNGGK